MTALAAFEPIRRRKVYEQITDQLERMIRAGAFSEGNELPSERELMKRFEVGRPAIREAMLELQRSGLITLLNGRPARVTRPTMARMLERLSPAARMMLAEPGGMRDFQAARRIFEIAIARDVASRATETDIATLRAALDRNKAARGEAEAFKRSDLDFHHAIATIAGNPILIALQQALDDWLLDQRTVSLRQPGAEPRTVAFHSRIFEAIAARDPDAAEAAMGEHLDDVARLYWRELEGAATRRAKPRRTRTKPNEAGRGR